MAVSRSQGMEKTLEDEQYNVESSAARSPRRSWRRDVRRAGARASFVLDLRRRGDEGLHRRRHARESRREPPADLLRADERRSARTWSAARTASRSSGPSRWPARRSRRRTASRSTRSRRARSSASALHPLRSGQPAGSRESARAMFKCPEKTPPAPGKHCDSVEGHRPSATGDAADTDASERGNVACSSSRSGCRPLLSA